MKLIDFGLSDYAKGDGAHSFRGTEGYMAPEIHLSNIYNAKQPISLHLAL